jgi:hypothetical protein|tara:strand:- start:437 stop:592 length:156 start_codon:yes stop_codon:yes gene_type:complete
MSDYWFLCPVTGAIKWAGKFRDYDDCDLFLEENNIDPVWIFSEKPEVEEAR